MTKQLSNSIRILALSFLWQGTGGATLLTFSISDYAGSPLAASTPKSMSIFAHYGDRAESNTAFVPEKGYEEEPFTYNYEEGNGFTPNISLKINASEGCEVTYYNEPRWPEVCFLHGASGKKEYYFTFTADPGFATKINSFKLFGFLDSIAHRALWSIRQDTPDGNELESGEALVNGNDRPAEVDTPSGNPQDGPLTVNTTGTAYPRTIVLVIEHVEGSGSGFALDDLNFDQVAVKKP